MGDRMKETQEANPPIGKMIDKQTLLFGFIAPTATSSKLPRAFGHYFEANGLNASMVGLNIREEDLRFTLNGLKSSQLRGVLLDPLYGKDALSAMDFATEEAQIAGFIDACAVQHGKLVGHIASALAAVSLVDFGIHKRIALWGTGGMAKALTLQLDFAKWDEIVLISDRVESAMELIETVAAHMKHARFDIMRANDALSFNASKVDALINATSVGTYAHDKALRISGLETSHTLLDFAFHGAATCSSFEDYAKAAQANYIGGYDIMAQAASTHFKVWFKQEPKQLFLPIKRG